MHQDRQELRLIALDMALGFLVAEAPTCTADGIVACAKIFEEYLAGPEPGIVANPNVFPINIVSRD